MYRRMFGDRSNPCGTLRLTSAFDGINTQTSPPFDLPLASSYKSNPSSTRILQPHISFSSAFAMAEINAIREGQYSIKNLAYITQVITASGEKGRSAVALRDHEFTLPSFSAVGEREQDPRPQQRVRRWSCFLGTLALTNLFFFSGTSTAMTGLVTSSRTARLESTLIKTVTMSLFGARLPCGTSPMNTQDASSSFTQSSSLNRN